MKKYKNKYHWHKNCMTTSNKKSKLKITKLNIINQQQLKTLKNIHAKIKPLTICKPALTSGSLCCLSSIAAVY